MYVRVCVSSLKKFKTSQQLVIVINDQCVCLSHAVGGIGVPFCAPRLSTYMAVSRVYYKPVLFSFFMIFFALVQLSCIFCALLSFIIGPICLPSSICHYLKLLSSTIANISSHIPLKVFIVHLFVIFLDTWR